MSCGRDIQRVCWTTLGSGERAGRGFGCKLWVDGAVVLHRNRAAFANMVLYAKNCCVWLLCMVVGVTCMRSGFSCAVGRDTVLAAQCELLVRCELFVRCCAACHLLRRRSRTTVLCSCRHASCGAAVAMTLQPGMACCCRQACARDFRSSLSAHQFIPTIILLCRRALPCATQHTPHSVQQRVRYLRQSCSVQPLKRPGRSWVAKCCSAVVGVGHEVAAVASCLMCPCSCEKKPQSKSSNRSLHLGPFERSAIQHFTAPQPHHPMVQCNADVQPPTQPPRRSRLGPKQLLLLS